MARPSTENPSKDARRESWINPAEEVPADADPQYPFDRSILFLKTPDELDAWVRTHGVPELFRFFRYTLEDHDSVTAAHNGMVDQITDRNHELEKAEILKQTLEKAVTDRDAAVLAAQKTIEERDADLDKAAAVNHTFQRTIEERDTELDAAQTQNQNLATELTLKIDTIANL